jgi:hypothetical protein
VVQHHEGARLEISVHTFLLQRTLVGFRADSSRPRSSECLSSTIAWYNDDYDNGYQGIVGVTEVPGFPE